MTKAKIMKLAEFPKHDMPIEWMRGGREEYYRLLPLIEALAESNEKLVETLKYYAEFDQAFCTLIATSEDIKGGVYGQAATALAEHEIRMKELSK